MTTGRPQGEEAKHLDDLRTILDDDRQAFQDIRQAIAPDGVCDCEGPCDVYRIYTIANDRLAAHGESS
jgi:hypothetical protein